MKYKYKPNSKLEHFGLRVYLALVENFPQTFFVGGMVRDLLLKRKIWDIDIATSAKPNEVINFLKINHIPFNDINIKFGVITAIKNKYKIEIASFRKETYGLTRYPKVKFTKSLSKDALRRDFTINSLYLSIKKQEIIDPFQGIKDIKLKQLRFIGSSFKKITKDPLRIIRALRFALQLNFRIEKHSWLAIKNNFTLIKKLTEKKKISEVNKLKSSKIKNLLKNIISCKKPLDSIEKKFYH